MTECVSQPRLVLHDHGNSRDEKAFSYGVNGTDTQATDYFKEISICDQLHRMVRIDFVLLNVHFLGPPLLEVRIVPHRPHNEVGRIRIGNFRKRRVDHESH